MNLFNKKPVLAVAPEVEADNTTDVPWIRASYQHNDTFLRLAAHAKNWRLFSFAMLIVTLIAVGGIIYIGSKSKFVPMVIEVDKLGQTVAVRALTGDDAVVDAHRMVYREMFDLIENLRSVTTDRKANNSRLVKGFSRLAGAAYTYVQTELRKNPPNVVGETKSVQVRVTSALRLAGKSWQIDWEEQTFNLGGVDLGTERWRATVQYDLLPLGDEASIRINPIGFTISDISWQKVI
jgi:type IV secretory pathway TrbF-like protein